MDEMNKAAQLISEAITGSDCKIVVVADIMYTVYPPTIHKISKAIGYLSRIGLEDGENLKEVLIALKDTPELCSKAVSAFITGDERLYEDLAKGTLEENINALSECISLISTEGFTTLLALAKNVARLAATPK